LLEAALRGMAGKLGRNPARRNEFVDISGPAAQISAAAG
jgi:hypothetical protein